MAEKEERIYVGKINWQEPLGFCPVPMEECNRFCKDCQGGMTRQEAIERMAKAMYDFEIVACSHEECGNKQCENCEIWKWCENIAEAALNALLDKGE